MFAQRSIGKYEVSSDILQSEGCLPTPTTQYKDDVELISTEWLEWEALMSPFSPSALEHCTLQNFTTSKLVSEYYLHHQKRGWLEVLISLPWGINPGQAAT